MWAQISEKAEHDDKWRKHFPNGASDWNPIELLTEEEWRMYLGNAGFNVEALQLRAIPSSYRSEEETYERLRAAWGPMFPTLAATADRQAFFRELACQIHENLPADTDDVFGNIVIEFAATPHR